LPQVGQAASAVLVPVVPVRTTAMTRLVVLPALAILVVAGGRLAAEEPPHREFVQGLRERHYADLALQYLEKLAKIPSPDVAKWLPLEMAKTRLELARDEADAGKRTELFAKAQAEFDAFVKSNPNDPRAAEASLELGRLVSLQGKAQLSQALKRDPGEARKAESEKARAQFKAAGQRLAQAAAQIDAQLAKLNNPQTPAEKDAKRDLTRARLQAELEIGLNLMDEMQTYDEITDAVARGDVAKKAGEVFEKLGTRDDTSPICWQARAWRARCFQEIDDPKKALALYGKIIDEANPAADAAKRLARYFRLLILDKDPAVKEPLPLIVQEGEKWRDTYRNYLKTPEGYGVRFQLAEAYLNQALRIPKAQQAQARAQELYGKAEKLYDELEHGENDYTQRARERKLNIIITRSGERTKGDINKLQNFQECYLRAQAEIGHLMEEAKKAKDAPPAAQKKNEEQRQQHFTNIIAALTRALDLADAKTPAVDRTEARYILGYAYLSAGDPYRAALVCEDLARTEPKSNRAATAAGYALEGYTQVIGEEERGAARASYLKADRERLRKLAEYMEKTWPADSATDFARHQLGLLALRETRYPEAVALLSRITPGYGAFIISQFQLASAAEKAQKEKVDPPKGQPSWPEQAEAALRKIPELPTNADPETARVYVYAKLELAKTLFASRKYKEMKALSDDLRKRFPDFKAKLPKGVPEEVEPLVQALDVYVTYGLADAAYREGKFAEARTLVEPKVALVKANTLPGAKDPQMVRALLGLALRANVQEGNNKAAQEVLDLLQKQAGDLEGGATVILVDLVQQLKGQIEELKQKGPGAEAELKKTTASFSSFLDSLASQPAKDLKPEVIRFLAFSYAGLDQHAKAAELLAKVPKPEPSKNPDPATKAAEDQRNEALHQDVRLLYARELRLAKQFDEADKVLKEMLATEQGKRSIGVQKELIFLLEDQEKYVPAFKAWDKLMKEKLHPRLQDARYKEQYYEAYYHLTFCYYKYASKLTDENKKQAAIKRAAGFITKLEGSVPDRGGEALRKKYDELLEKEPDLKQRYEELKNGSQ
jgi:hypothetical protein